MIKDIPCIMNRTLSLYALSSLTYYKQACHFALHVMVYFIWVMWKLTEPNEKKNAPVVENKYKLNQLLVHAMKTDYGMWKQPLIFNRIFYNHFKSGLVIALKLYFIYFFA